jgi:UPF0755 protein
LRGFFLVFYGLMKKIILILFLLIVLTAVAGAWMVLGPGTGFSEKKETLYIASDGVSKEAVMDSLRKRKIVRNETVFLLLADRLNYWGRIKPGKYEFDKGSSLLSIIRKLRNGQQTPVKLTINKLRTKEDLAKMTGNKFEFDSADMINFLNTNDSLKNFGVSSEQAMTMVVPDTYTFFWNTTPKKVISRLHEESEKFWKSREGKAKEKGMSKEEAIILASIVEEETNANKEKGTIASVYRNRLKKGMPLQADPTVKFALKDFTLRRIYHTHLTVESPYNTYRNKGLPPGPICTPSKTTVDAVLNAPETEYYYFVASPAFDGTHEFSKTYEEHLVKAKRYQEALNERGLGKPEKK